MKPILLAGASNASIISYVLILKRKLQKIPKKNDNKLFY